MQRLGDLQIGNVLHLIGDQGRAVIGEMFHGLGDASLAPHPVKSAASTARLGRLTQTVKYFGKPRAVAKLDVDSLVALARESRGTIVMACAVGDTLVSRWTCACSRSPAEIARRSGTGCIGHALAPAV
jgi:hypothetical protein